MNAGRLLELFERISEAPDAVPRLRRFVLDLAVRGKLVEQDSGNESAAELFNRIELEKKRMVKEGIIRSPRILEGGEQQDDLPQIPGSWVWCRLSDVGAIVGGGTPPSADSDNFTTGGAGIAWLTPADLGKHTGLYVSHGARDLTQLGLRVSSAALMPPGAVLFTSRAPIGYTAIAANEISTNQGFKSVVPYIPECGLYIEVYFRAFGKWIDQKASGTTFREVSGKIVSNLPFPLPPMVEQQRIVARVGELMALCDRLDVAQREREERRKRLMASSLQRLCEPADDVLAFRDHVRFHLRNLPRFTTRFDDIDHLRQAILDLAIRGLLSQRMSADEPPSLDLDRLNVKYDKDVLSNAVQNIALPESWLLAPLAQVADEIVDCPHSTPKWTPDGNVCVRTNQFRPGRLDLSETRFVSKATYLERIQRLKPIQDDILYSREGGILGVACRVPPKTDLCLGQRMMLIRSGRAARPAFLEMVLNSPFLTDIAQERTIGGAAPRVNVSTVKGYPIPIPPLGEQDRIVAKVSELMTLCHRIDSQLATIKTESGRLLESVLHHALANAA